MYIVRDYVHPVDVCHCIIMNFENYIHLAVHVSFEVVFVFTSLLRGLAKCPIVLLIDILPIWLLVCAIDLVSTYYPPVEAVSLPFLSLPTLFQHHSLSYIHTLFFPFIH